MPAANGNTDKVLLLTIGLVRKPSYCPHLVADTMKPYHLVNTRKRSKLTRISNFKKNLKQKVHWNNKQKVQTNGKHLSASWITASATDHIDVNSYKVCQTSFFYWYQLLIRTKFRTSYLLGSPHVTFHTVLCFLQWSALLCNLC